MRNAQNEPLSYQLYQDAAYAVSWGSVEQTQFGQPVAVDVTLPPFFGSASTTRTIYARVLPSQQTAATGSYSSTFSGSQVRFNYIFYIGPPPAYSAINTNPTRPSFTVTATASANCLVSAQNLNFGLRGVLDANVDAAGAVQTRCTPGTAYAIGFNGGLANGTPTTRRMTQGPNSILYGLYRDSTRTQPWGDEPANRQPGIGSGLAQNFPVYGRVAPQPTPPLGTYSDTVVVTVRY